MISASQSSGQESFSKTNDELFKIHYVLYGLMAYMASHYIYIYIEISKQTRSPETGNQCVMHCSQQVCEQSRYVTKCSPYKRANSQNELAIKKGERRGRHCSQQYASKQCYISIYIDIYNMTSLWAVWWYDINISSTRLKLYVHASKTWASHSVKRLMGYLKYSTCYMLPWRIWLATI